jgi:hypothetical protein
MQRESEREYLVRQASDAKAAIHQTMRRVVKERPWMVLGSATITGLAFGWLLGKRGDPARGSDTVIITREPAKASKLATLASIGRVLSETANILTRAAALGAAYGATQPTDSMTSGDSMPAPDQSALSSAEDSAGDEASA